MKTIVLRQAGVGLMVGLQVGVMRVPLKTIKREIKWETCTRSCGPGNHSSIPAAGGVSTQTLLRRVQGGPFPSLIFLSHLPLSHSEDTSVFGLLLTCMRSFPTLNLYNAKKKKHLVWLDLRLLLCSIKRCPPGSLLSTWDFVKIILQSSCPLQLSRFKMLTSRVIRGSLPFASFELYLSDSPQSPCGLDRRKWRTLRRSRS